MHFTLLKNEALSKRMWKCEGEEERKFYPKTERTTKMKTYKKVGTAVLVLKEIPRYQK